MRSRIFLRILPFLAPLVAAGGAAAQPAQPLDRLLPQIRRDHPGQFLDAEGANQNGDPHYHLKWLTPDGRVMWLDTDARTGRVLSQSPGRDAFDAPRYRAPQNESGPPLDRRDEGQRFTPRDEPQYAPRYDNRGAAPQPYGQRFDSRGENFVPFGGGPGNGRIGGERGFGGAPSGGFGNRNFGGGGRDRRDGR
ncbi:MAG: hypothetical protein JO256_01130 [Alphaproteobacteria bacterium]|nr:hypothetical protein [Alphaproteobacteria bacterium]